MTDFSMWGAEASPSRLIEQDQQKAALVMSQLAHNQALARTENAQASIREAEAEGQKKLAAAMAGMQSNGNNADQSPGNNTRSSLATPLEQMSSMAMASGLPSQAAKYAGEA